MNSVKVVKLLKYQRPSRGLIKEADVVPSAKAGKVGGEATAYEKDSIMKRVEFLEKLIKALEMEKN